jgi:hypothetical protein
VCGPTPSSVCSWELSSHEVHESRYDERTDEKASTDTHCSRPDEEERSDHFYY